MFCPTKTANNKLNYSRKSKMKEIGIAPWTGQRKG